MGAMYLKEDNSSTYYGGIETVGLGLDVWDDINGYTHSISC